MQSQWPSLSVGGSSHEPLRSIFFFVAFRLPPSTSSSQPPSLGNQRNNSADLRADGRDGSPRKETHRVRNPPAGAVFAGSRCGFTTGDTYRHSLVLKPSSPSKLNPLSAARPDFRYSNADHDPAAIKESHPPEYSAGGVASQLTLPANLISDYKYFKVEKS